MTAIKLNKLDWLLWAINHMKHERVHVCFWALFVAVSTDLTLAWFEDQSEDTSANASRG